MRECKRGHALDTPVEMVLRFNSDGAEEQPMTQRHSIHVWKAADLQYRPIGRDGKMQYCNPIEPDISGCHAGYLDVRGGTLDWTEAGDEVIWVLSGHVTITHGDETYELSPGDVIFMRDGITLRMTGTQDARIAYVSHLH